MIARKQKNRPAEKTKTRQPLPPEKPATKPPVVQGVKPLTIEIDIEAIDAQPFNPRTKFDQAELESLAVSLRDNGLLQPIIVRAAAAGRYELIAGGRRLKAAKLAGWNTVPATVRNATDEDAITWALVENVDRAELNPIDLARGVARLCAPKANGGCGLPETEAAAAMGRAVHWVRRQIRLLRLPEIWLQRIASGEISPGAGEVLVKYEHRPAVLAQIEQDMLANRWAWRTIEDFERSAAMIAEADEADPASVEPRELKPMRSSPGESEKPNTLWKRAWRQRRSDSQPTAADEELSAASEREPAASTPATDPATYEPAALENLPTQRVDVAQIVELIDLVDDIADLNEITFALDRRRRQLAEASAAG